MSIRDEDDWAGPIPEEMVRVARAAFPKGSVAMQMRDLCGASVRTRDLDRAYLTRGEGSKRCGAWRW